MIKMTIVNIDKVMNDNPITILSGKYQSKLVMSIKQQFNNEQQKLFIGSFYYLNYDSLFWTLLCLFCTHHAFFASRR